MDKTIPYTQLQTCTLKSGTPYSLADLTHLDVPSIFNNQCCVIEALLPHQRSFILPKNREDYLRHFEQGHKAIGCFIDGKLIGHSLVYTPRSSDEGTGMVDMPDFHHDHQQTVVIKNTCVLPQWRNNGLAGQMARLWHNPLLAGDRTYCLAEVAYGNLQSLASLLSANFFVVGMGTDPDDQTIVFNMMARHHSSQANINKSDECLYLSLAGGPEQIASALKQGYHGVRCHRTSCGTQLVMARQQIFE